MDPVEEERQARRAEERVQRDQQPAFFFFFFSKIYNTVLDRSPPQTRLSYHRQERLSVSKKKSNLRGERTRYRLLVTNL